MKKLLKIMESNKLIHFKNRYVRTPVTLEVTDDELKKLHIALRMADIQKFEIITVEGNKGKKVYLEETRVDKDKSIIVEELEKEMEIIPENQDKTVIEDLEEEEPEPLTILEKLMRNEEE